MSILDQFSPEQLAAFSPEQLAALAGNASTTDDAPKGKASKGNAASKSKAVKVPTWDHTTDDGTRWQLTMAHESKPGQDGSTVYREPRVLIRAMSQGADDYRKITTIPAALLQLVREVPDAKVTAMAEYASANKRIA